MLRCLALLVTIFFVHQSNLLAQSDLPADSLMRYDTLTISQFKSNPDFQYSKPELKSSNWFETLKLRILNIINKIMSSDGFGLVAIFILSAIFIAIITIIIIRGRIEQVTASDDRYGLISDNPLVISNISPRYQLKLALDEGDFRMAYRWRFIIYLLSLSDAGFIKLNSHKTNHDYARELKGTVWQPIFNKLSNAFDYIWYGHMPISESDFNEFDILFKTTPDAILKFEPLLPRNGAIRKPRILVVIDEFGSNEVIN